jgi:hypothetical protein
MSQKMAVQSKASCSNPPIEGATIGAMASPIVT